MRQPFPHPINLWEKADPKGLRFAGKVEDFQIPIDPISLISNPSRFPIFCPITDANINWLLGRLSMHKISPLLEVT